MARNDHDGRSLEERLASLDAMNSEATGPSAVPPAPKPAAGEPVPPSEDAAGSESSGNMESSESSANPENPANAEGPDNDEATLVEPGEQVAASEARQGSAPPSESELNPWLAAPPPFQGGPPLGPPPGPPQGDPPQDGPPQGGPPQEGFTPPGENAGFTPPGESAMPPPPGFPPAYNDFNAPPPYAAPPPPPYQGGPMPQPFDGGMLPPPYAGNFQQPDQGPPPPPYQQPPLPQPPSNEPHPPYNEGQPPFGEGQPPYNPNQPPFNPSQPPYSEGQPPFTPAPFPEGQPPFNANQPPLPQPPFPEGPPQQPDGGNAPYQPPNQPPSNGQGAPPLEQLPPFPPGQFGQPEPPQGLPPQPPQGASQYPPYGPADQGEQGMPPQPPQGGVPYNAGQAPPQQGYGPPAQIPPADHLIPGMSPNPYQQGYEQQAYEQQGYPQQPPQPETAESLSSENLLGERRIAPSSGWRRAVYKATAGSVHPGESQTESRRKDLIARARQPVGGGHHRVAVMSLKGGVGKTTTTTCLGSMLASMRGDRVIAVDANPDRGTLSDKVKLETAATVRDLLNGREQIHRYADVRGYTSQNVARLEVLASDRDPAVSEAFSAEDYSAVAVVLEQYYSICITDCGTGLLHSAMAGVLSLADQLVLVSSPSVDGARSASATLDWLEAHDHGHLVRNGVVVLSMVRNRTRSQVDLDKLQAHFESRCRAVVRIPYDDHLEEGAEVELEALAPHTREAYLNLAAVVGDGLGYQRPLGE
ncbi:MinD/ParA family protein [Actinomadura sp. 9N407]|uniref:MinD/ParA family protein n=1 Tax=Actinomadura sp. 9N407 TaxID=3375154 RepID=UPI0037A2D082